MNGASSPTPRNTLPRSALVEEEDDSFNTEDASGDQELMEAVISSLHVADRPVAVAEQFNNDKNQNRSMDKVPAYAKIAGRDWTYFVQDSRVNIGRPPDDKPNQTGAGQSSPAADTQDLFPVHIDLGPSKFISRHHAEISYRSDEGGSSGWQITVNGRNGVRLNNTLIKRGGTRPMRCGDILEIANTQMMFVTPNESPIIHPTFVEQARKVAAGEETWNDTHHAHPEPSESRKQPLPQSVLHLAPGNQAIAPAPPSFRREVTPPPRKIGDPPSQGAKQSPLYNRGVMMESTEDIDYSSDAAKDLKPPYSYATMIAQAIFSNEEEKLTLSNIYSYIMKRYAFYRNSQTGWQASTPSSCLHGAVTDVAFLEFNTTQSFAE